MISDVKDDKTSFEDFYKKVEIIARQLEDETIPLEKAFQLFEEGQKLLTRCQEMLDDAEKHLKVIQKSDEGIEIEETELE
jgi:exodeoxyribonuclease VII small subunit